MNWEKEFDKLFTVDCAGKNPPEINCRHWKQEDNVGGVKSFIRTHFISREELKDGLGAIRAKILKKARATDYADATEYDECAAMLDRYLASLEKPKQ